MTHEYTILLGGTVIPGADEPDAQAIAWARDMVLLVGSDEDVRSISRGDSHFVELGGAFVVPLGEADEPAWPPTTSLEPGTPASFAILDADPRAGPTRTLAIVRAGRVVEGSLAATRGPDTATNG